MQHGKGFQGTSANESLIAVSLMFGAVPISTHERIFASGFHSTLSHSLAFRRRKALLMTETELRLIAAPAMIGLSSKPKNG